MTLHSVIVIVVVVVVVVVVVLVMTYSDDADDADDDAVGSVVDLIVEDVPIVELALFYFIDYQ